MKGHVIAVVCVLYLKHYQKATKLSCSSLLFLKASTVDLLDLYLLDLQRQFLTNHSSDIKKKKSHPYAPPLSKPSHTNPTQRICFLFTKGHINLSKLFTAIHLLLLGRLSQLNQKKAKVVNTFFPLFYIYNVLGQTQHFFSSVKVHVFPRALTEISDSLVLFAGYANHVDEHNHKGLFQLLQCFCLNDSYLGSTIILFKISCFCCLGISRGQSLCYSLQYCNLVAS